MTRSGCGPAGGTYRACTPETNPRPETHCCKSAAQGVRHFAREGSFHPDARSISGADGSPPPLCNRLIHQASSREKTIRPASDAVRRQRAEPHEHRRSAHRRIAFALRPIRQRRLKTPEPPAPIQTERHRIIPPPHACRTRRRPVMAAADEPLSHGKPRGIPAPPQYAPPRRRFLRTTSALLKDVTKIV